MKTSVVALVVELNSGEPTLVEALHDSTEIDYFELALKEGQNDPLEKIHEFRARQLQQEDEFANYVEELLCQPFINPSIQEHGIQWFKSRMKIDQFQKAEKEAVHVISQYAYQIFAKDREKIDFLLFSPTNQVRIRIFAIP